MSVVTLLESPDGTEVADVLRRLGASDDDEELLLVRPGGDVELTPVGPATLRTSPGPPAAKAD
jgi:hypothetical protein